jgi:hypothetical protein
LDDALAKICYIDNLVLDLFNTIYDDSIFSQTGSSQFRPAGSLADLAGIVFARHLPPGLLGARRRP